MKNILKIFILCLIVLFSLISCTDNKDEKEYINVTYVVDEENQFVLSYEKGKNISQPEDPQKEGYIFKGWYYYDEYEGERLIWKFNLYVCNFDLKLYAKFESKYDLSTVVFSDDDFTYTGEEYSIYCQNVPEGVNVEYHNNGQNKVGTYLVTAILYGEENPNEEIGRLYATLNISHPVIRVGATSSPHATILESDAVKKFVESKGYKLEVVVYQDYITPNKALDDGRIDANYFQHIPYLEEEIASKGYKISTACKVHNEPLNLYGKEKKETWNDTKIYIVNDASNVERAFKLLLANGLIDSYDVENFNAQRPVYETSIGVIIECIDPGLLPYKVEEGGYAVIPGNYAFTAWDTAVAIQYKLFGESTEVAHPNIVAVRTEDLNSEKIRVLVEALSQSTVKEFIEKEFGPTVNYCFESFIE